ncbi:MAG TPA: S24 family peptidase [Hyphomicrobiales bacterium]|nr:S24 family peptidase [Hyphomicrobiales bacterium]
MVHSDTIRSAFSARLWDSLKKSGLDGRGAGAMLSRITGASPKASSKWLNGEAIPARSRLEIIARKTGVRPEWLEYGIEPMYPDADAPSSASAGNVYPVGNTPRKVPLLTRIPDDTETGMIMDDNVDEWVDTYIDVTEGMFALRVVGEVMLNPVGAPSFPEGTIIIVNPKKSPKHRSLVVVREPGKAPIFRKLSIVGDDRYLLPLNPRYEPEKITGPVQFLGCVVAGQIEIE